MTNYLNGPLWPNLVFKLKKTWQPCFNSSCCIWSIRPALIELFYERVELHLKSQTLGIIIIFYHSLVFDSSMFKVKMSCHIQFPWHISDYGHGIKCASLTWFRLEPFFCKWFGQPKKYCMYLTFKVITNRNSLVLPSMSLKSLYTWYICVCWYVATHL